MRLIRARGKADIVFLFLIIFVIVVFADRILKIAVIENFSLGSSYPVLENILHITPVHNKGIAFGLFGNVNNSVFICMVFLILLLMLFFIIYRRPRNSLLLSGVSLVASGAMGNIIDRIIYGHVFDFIDLRVWPVFNTADSAITIGAGLIMVCMFRQKSKAHDK
jgi:signal peptidase II